MLSTLCCLALLVPSAALQLKQQGPDTRPKSAKPEGVELIWQRPKGEVRGILLYLHGCHGKATGMWTSDGHDGFHLDVCDQTKKKKCMGYVEEIVLRQKARAQGYLVAAVSGGVGNPRNCMNTNDVPRIQLAMKHLVEVAEPDLADMPVILLGHSSGGRVLPELVTKGASIKNAKCIVPIADEIRIKGDSSAPLGLTKGYPEDVSAFFIHMEKDEGREGIVRQNIQQAKKAGVRVGDLKVKRGAVTPKLFMADGYGMKEETAKKVHAALKDISVVDEFYQEGPLLSNKTGLLVKNPYATGGPNWQLINETKTTKSPKELIQEIGGLQVLQQYMDVAWSEHWMAGGRYWKEIQEFCEQPGNERKHQVGKKQVDLVAQVHELDKQSEQFKNQEAKKNNKKNHGAQMKMKKK